MNRKSVKKLYNQKITLKQQKSPEGALRAFKLKGKYIIGMFIIMNGSDDS